MPLLLLNLDNTLLDRAGPFRAWGEEFLQQMGAPAEDIDWLLDVDADGLTDRWDLAEALRDRYRLRVSSVDIVEELHDGIVAKTRLNPMVACALQIAGDAGWVPVVVSNGTVRQQEAKIRRTGLDRYLADWVISEEVGVSKPNPRIFAIGAERARMRLSGAWMIGDSPEADIGGASEVGLRSVWLHRGRHWTEQRYAPTCTADGAIAAIAAALDYRSPDRPPSARPSSDRPPSARPPSARRPPEPRLPEPRSMEPRSMGPSQMEPRSMERRPAERGSLDRR